RPRLFPLFPYTTLFRSKHELPLGFGEHALADQVSGSDSGCTLDVIIEAIDRHGELVGVEGKLPLFVEVLIDELAQRIDGCTRRLDRKSTRLNSSHVSIS